MTSAKRWLGLTLAAALTALVAGGCGYSAEPLHRSDVRTVSVNIFASKEFRRELEFDLSRALVKTLEMRTPYKVVHDPKRADSEIRGEIVLLNAPVLTDNVRTDNPSEVEVTLVCWFEWKDLRTGQILARKDDLTASGTYAVAVGETQDSATSDAVARLARRIVEAMEKPW
ncbi:MAG: LPS assembly lipoprotein LptE [Planctomycetota bacterium]|nr:LPS assembly lipoprotein LptE [Planctomycetota bacterium]